MDPNISMAEMISGDVVEEAIEILTDSDTITDVWLASGDPVMVRTPDGWIPLESMPTPSFEEMSAAAGSLDSDWKQNIVLSSISRARELGGWRIRQTAYLADCGTKLVMAIRRLPLTPMSLRAAGLPMSVQLISESPRGLILISGATRAGKSSTMAAIIESLNQNRACHVVTIEDPIEYRHRQVKAIFSLREVGVDCPTYAVGVRDAMRQSPDVIAIGEIRDRDTAEAALLGAESGHLVIASLHANSAPGALQKLLAFFPDADRKSREGALAGCLQGVISQILLPRKDRQGYALAAEIIANNKGRYRNCLDSMTKTASVLEKHHEDGDKLSRTMTESLTDLIRAGTVSRADALRATTGIAGVYDAIAAIPEA